MPYGHSTRRNWRRRGGALALFCLLAAGDLSANYAAEDDLATVRRLARDDEVDIAIRRALSWLTGRQDQASGVFSGPLPNAYTALACMALMATGEQPGRTPYGEAVQSGLLFLAAQAEKNHGYLGGDGGRMYGHAMATLALCEGYGMLATPAANHAVGTAIRQALEVILAAQVLADASPHAGGWRYEPTGSDADLSVTVWQILALRAAANCGFDIPESTVQASLHYLRRLHDGVGFTYQVGRAPSTAMRAAGVVGMKALGADLTADDQKKIAASAQILASVDPSHGQYFYYQSYYLATAANLLGGEVASEFLPKLERALLHLQTDDGQFAKHGGRDGGVYSTAFAVLSLAVRYQFLPIFQE